MDIKKLFVIMTCLLISLTVANILFAIIILVKGEFPTILFTGTFTVLLAWVFLLKVKETNVILKEIYNNIKSNYFSK
ncbi:putative membrane protein [Paenibacillus peoriae]|uniref:Uncharacterized protein n=2 Tax=Paenibacillus TaxID=44249 RepID=A0ABX2ZAF1_PAEPO|nr:putative membrane protein [Paenibacillus peoriae]ODA08270.1 hypothetical protein A7312_27780 [Paenibacillus polymyxa]